MDGSAITRQGLNRTEPELSYVPRILQFIGYCPYVPTIDLIERLKTVRWALGLSQKQAAKILEVGESTIAGWERKEHRPTKRSLRVIQSLFKLPFLGVLG